MIRFVNAADTKALLINEDAVSAVGEIGPESTALHLDSGAIFHVAGPVESVEARLKELLR